MTKVTNAELLDLTEGLGLILDIDDLDVLFSWRLSGIATTIEPKIKRYSQTKRKLDKEYSEDTKDEDGKPTQRVPPHKVNEWVEKSEVLLEAGNEFSTLGTIKLSELRKMSEEEDIPISGKIIRFLRVVIVEDIDPVDGTKKKVEPKEKTSRSTRRSEARDKATEEKEEEE